MALKIHFPLIIFGFVIGESVALTITLTHIYASDSPFHVANLTDQQIVTRLNLRTKSHENENKTLLDFQAIRPPLEFESFSSVFLVKVSLGTFSNIRGSSRKSYYLLLDTGGSEIWMQCEDCKKPENHCFRQMEQPFPNSKSRSYRPLPCNRHPLCHQNRCIGDSCSYFAYYTDNSHSIGILAHEEFSFPSMTGHDEIVPLVFGCGINNKNTYLEDQDIKMAGVFGLGRGPRSFITQTHSINNGQFSYCLPSGIQLARGLPSFLRFGLDIPYYSSLPNTRMIQYQYEYAYYVNLMDISINGARLNIPSIYTQKRKFEGRCIFDTGCALTRVSPSAYHMIEQAVKRHIARYLENLEIDGHLFGYDLCYRASKPFRGHDNLPFVTFHFEGDANLVVKPDVAFYIASDNTRYDYICLSMIPSSNGKLTTIGSDLQANQFIVYDVFGQRLYFGPQDCSRNP